MKHHRGSDDRARHRHHRSNRNLPGPPRMSEARFDHRIPNPSDKPRARRDRSRRKHPQHELDEIHERLRELLRRKRLRRELRRMTRRYQTPRSQSENPHQPIRHVVSHGNHEHVVGRRLRRIVTLGTRMGQFPRRLQFETPSELPVEILPHHHRDQRWFSRREKNAGTEQSKLDRRLSSERTVRHRTRRNPHELETEFLVRPKKSRI